MGLFKRGQVWWMRFSYQGRQVKRSTEVSDKKLAEKIHAKVITQIVEGKWFDVDPGRDKTFRGMMEKYLSECSISKSHASKLRDVSASKQLLPHFGDYTLADITPRLISSYKTKRRQYGAAPATVNKELGLAKHAYNIARKEWEWCRDNPFQLVSMEKVNNARVRYLTDEEFENLLEACEDWFRPIVIVAWHSGMRRGNILSLRFNQVDLFRRVILLDHTKNGERLGIPINDTLYELLKGLSKVRSIKSPFVFDGIYPVQTQRGIKEACKKVGIENFRFHDLRHCFASSLVQRGVDLFRVQKLLGHKDGRMTQRYAHLAPENLREAIKALDTPISPILAHFQEKGATVIP